MRTIGFVLLLLGGLIIYLAWKAKLGDAFNAVFSGTVPTTSSTKTPSNGKDMTPSDNVPGTLPGSGGLIQGGYS